MALSAPEKASKLDSDLQSILAHLNIPIDQQAALFDAEFTSIRLLSIIGDDRPSARRNISDMFRIDPNEMGLDQAVKRQRIAIVTKLVAAWEKCKTRSEEVDRNEAARATSQLPRQMARQEIRGTKSLFEAQFFKVPEEADPAKSYVEVLDDRIQDGEFRAEKLTEVLLEEPDDEGDDETLTIDRATARFRIARRKKKGAMPADTEEYRTVMKTLGIAWTFLRLRHNNRQWLHTMTPDVIQRHVDFILGDQVRKLVCKDDTGRVIKRPSWPLILSYCHQLRKKALRLVEEGLNDIAAAYESARKDSVTRDRYFLTPLQVQRASSRSRSPPRLAGDHSHGSGGNGMANTSDRAGYHGSNGGQRFLRWQGLWEGERWLQQQGWR